MTKENNKTRILNLLKCISSFTYLKHVTYFNKQGNPFQFICNRFKCTIKLSFQLREKFRKAIFWVKIALKFSNSASGR